MLDFRLLAIGCVCVRARDVWQFEKKSDNDNVSIKTILCGEV